LTISLSTYRLQTTISTTVARPHVGVARDDLRTMKFCVPLYRDGSTLNYLKYVWIILLKNDFWISQGNVEAIDVKFSQDLTHQKSLKSVNF